MHIYAFDETTGAQRWVTAPIAVGDGVNAVFVLTTKTVYVYFDSALALNAVTGAIRWHAPSTAISGVFGKLFLDASHLFTLSPNEVTAYDSASGTRLWQHTGNMEAMGVAHDTVYTYLLQSPSQAHPSGSITFVAFKGATGAVVWQGLQTTVQDLPQFLVIDGTVIVVASSGGFFALNAATGLQLWRATAVAGGAQGIAPIIQSGAVFLSTGQALYALEEATGLLVWKNTSLTAMSFPSNFTLAF